MEWKPNVHQYCRAARGRSFGSAGKSGQDKRGCTRGWAATEPSLFHLLWVEVIDVLDYDLPQDVLLAGHGVLVHCHYVAFHFRCVASAGCTTVGVENLSSLFAPFLTFYPFIFPRWNRRPRKNVSPSVGVLLDFLFTQKFPSRHCTPNINTVHTLTPLAALVAQTNRTDGERAKNKTKTPNNWKQIAL